MRSQYYKNFDCFGKQILSFVSKSAKQKAKFYSCLVYGT